ncbi:hypothetical protein, unlikely [Trypanosoma brucei gambiense DAL972]|uniref:Uncharacterized protein n=1 Tax=Trypanosoma brucei gambiense (strain MHOM/CI/86/DAL972) TaxID=679716 RepID=D0A2F7_TRYB9|nr:hypothetical protein, unlikely [Trypanosoma brucei gambiense DAL972]CBH15451.1 hypothetical protein, unlikely [Trypanosoma brucei gambiense DAL972]|eukprot:XP_011777715.1 hypothetical protein, unlikely [Trypanosoma brucei gambiense DAL972]
MYLSNSDKALLAYFVRKTFRSTAIIIIDKSMKSAAVSGGTYGQEGTNKRISKCMNVVNTESVFGLLCPSSTSEKNTTLLAVNRVSTMCGRFLPISPSSLQPYETIPRTPKKDKRSH